MNIKEDENVKAFIEAKELPEDISSDALFLELLKALAE